MNKKCRHLELITLLQLAERYHMVLALPSCFRFDQFMCDWLNHTTWFHSNRKNLSTAQKHGIWVNIALFCLHNTDANMLCRLFDDRKYMDIYLPIHQEYGYLCKQKISLYFPTSTCEHLWPSPSHFVNCAKCSHNSSKDVADWSVWNIF